MDETNEVNEMDDIEEMDHTDSHTSHSSMDESGDLFGVDIFNLLSNQNSDSENNFSLITDSDVGDATRVVRGGDPDHVIVPPTLETVTYYDQNLTSAHKYLGDALRETSGRTIFEENVLHIIPVVFLKLHLMPGQILPIIARSESVKLLLKYALARNRAFGVAYKLNPDGQPTYGTIAEVYEHSVPMTPTSQSFQIKTMGRQRFKIMTFTHFPESLEQAFVLAEVKILSDITLTHPYNKLCLHPKNRNSRHSETCRKKDMWQTPWPDWVYKQNDANYLASLVAKKVEQHYKHVKISDDPYSLSFQVIRLGLFTPDQVNFLLGVESTNLRLQYELHYWKWNNNQSIQKFMCATNGCETVICKMSDIFPMSPEGPQGTYCNTWGQIHDMITVTELDNNLDVIDIGSPSSECCWFPGYKWLIILCPHCFGFLGWRYLADDNSTLMPRLFYGLCMRAITLKNMDFQENSR